LNNFNKPCTTRHALAGQGFILLKIIVKISELSANYDKLSVDNPDSQTFSNYPNGRTCYGRGHSQDFRGTWDSSTGSASGHAGATDESGAAIAGNRGQFAAERFRYRTDACAGR